MGSMDKMKDQKKIESWTTKYYENGYIVSDKLDGTSGLVVYENNTIKIYTRGNGHIAQDISYLQKYTKLPKTLQNKTIVRGEFIISKTKWQKYKNKFSNARNFVSGLINSKKVSPKLIKDIDFVAYELIEPIVTQKEQFILLQQYGFNVVYNTFINNVSMDLLSDILTKRRETSKYEVDCIISTNNNIFKREEEKNPKHSIAFKMVITEDIVETTILDVEWNASMWGVLKPRIRVSPVLIQGVTINWVTGINAKFMLHNTIGGPIGPGAVVQIIRSGDVIPKIIKVVVPVKETEVKTYVD